MFKKIGRFFSSLFQVLVPVGVELARERALHEAAEKLQPYLDRMDDVQKYDTALGAVRRILDTGEVTGADVEVLYEAVATRQGRIDYPLFADALRRFLDAAAVVQAANRGEQ